MIADDLRDILRTPYALGGRVVGASIDCLGVVGEVARRRGLPPPDGWPQIRQAWERGDLPSGTGFPAGWVRCLADGPLQDGDVLLFFGAHPWCAIVHRGLVVSASASVGSAYSVPLHRWKKAPAEVWRWCP